MFRQAEDVVGTLLDSSWFILIHLDSLIHRPWTKYSIVGFHGYKVCLSSTWACLNSIRYFDLEKLRKTDNWYPYSLYMPKNTCQVLPSTAPIINRWLNDRPQRWCQYQLLQVHVACCRCAHRSFPAAWLNRFGHGAQLDCHSWIANGS